MPGWRRWTHGAALTLAVAAVAILLNGRQLAAANDPTPGPGPGPTATAAIPAAPPFPEEAIKKLLASLEQMMVTGSHRDFEKLVWEGLPVADRDNWRQTMKHEFQQIAYKQYQTSIFDWRWISTEKAGEATRDKPREHPSIPEVLPPASVLWAVRVDIDYRYQPKSRTPPPADAVTGNDDDRDELATVCFYVIESAGEVRIVGNDRNFFMQFGQAPPRGLIGSWAIGLITFCLILVFWITMASHCWAARPKLRRWRWITAGLPFFGATAYFFMVYWRHPRRPLWSWSMLGGLRTAAVNIATLPIPGSTPAAPEQTAPAITATPAADQTVPPTPAGAPTVSPPQGANGSQAGDDADGVHRG